ncbi:hypothetical protein Vretimale_14706, partial [Volvox reticuliferus]
MVFKSVWTLRVVIWKRRQPYYSVQVRERVCHLYFVNRFMQEEIANLFGNRPSVRTVGTIIGDYNKRLVEVQPIRGQKGIRKPRVFDESAAQTLVELVQADDQASLFDVGNAMREAGRVVIRLFPMSSELLAAIQQAEQF